MLTRGRYRAARAAKNTALIITGKRFSKNLENSVKTNLKVLHSKGKIPVLRLDCKSSVGIVGGVAALAICFVRSSR